MIVTKGSTTVEIDVGMLKLLTRIEVWDSDGMDGKGNRKVANLVPMHTAHFQQCHATGAFKKDAVGRPFYFTRDKGGVQIHPATDKDYWFEPMFRKPIQIKAGTVGSDGIMQVRS